MESEPTFALLHGGGQGSWVWEQVTRALRARGATVLELDIPGCGTKRARETITLGVDEVAGELLGEIEAAGLHDVILVGHSQAGTMLPVLVDRRPDLFRRLVYVSCCAPLPGQSVIEMMGRSCHGENPEEVGWPLDPDVHGSDVQRPLAFCNDMDEQAAGDFLATLDRDNWPMAVTLAVHWGYDHLADVPSTYIICNRDGILPPSWQQRFAARLHAKQILHIDAGHQAMNTQPERLAALLLETAGHQ